MSTNPDLAGTLLTLPVGPRDHVRGPDGAPLTLVEFGDFQCPQCAQAYRIVRDLQGAFGERLRFAFRQFPLTNVHPQAQHAAEAAEWAATQGRFWEMHDALYASLDQLSDRDILAKAAALGLDPAALERDWRDHTFIPRVKEDFLGGIKSGVNGTPTFFINGARHDGAWDLAGLTQALESSVRL